MLAASAGLLALTLPGAGDAAGQPHMSGAVGDWGGHTVAIAAVEKSTDLGTGATGQIWIDNDPATITCAETVVDPTGGNDGMVFYAAARMGTGLTGPANLFVKLDGVADGVSMVRLGIASLPGDEGRNCGATGIDTSLGSGVAFHK